MESVEAIGRETSFQMPPEPKRSIPIDPSILFTLNNNILLNVNKEDTQELQPDVNIIPKNSSTNFYKKKKKKDLRNIYELVSFTDWV